jgi:hypothetical protein
MSLAATRLFALSTDLHPAHIIADDRTTRAAGNINRLIVILLFTYLSAQIY